MRLEHHGRAQNKLGAILIQVTLDGIQSVHNVRGAITTEDLGKKNAVKDFEQGSKPEAEKC
jgi:hypothetical protein